MAKQSAKSAAKTKGSKKAAGPKAAPKPQQVDQESKAEEYKAKQELRVTDALEAVLGMFEREDYPERIAITFLEKQKGHKPSDFWSFGNYLIMLLSGTRDARGYTQWNDVGRQVVAGAKAIWILAPVVKMVPVKGPDGMVMVDAEGKEIKVPRMLRTKGVPVFGVEDTTGEPLVEPDYTPPEAPPLMEIAKVFGVRVDYGPCVSDYLGVYMPGANRMELCTHDVRTWFHELAHAVHGTIRPLKGGQDPAQEIVAETVAAVLSYCYGYGGYVGHSARYIRAYAKGEKNPAGAVLKVLHNVEAVLARIFDAKAKVEAAPPDDEMPPMGAEASAA